MSLESMRLNRSIKMKWFTLDFNPYQRVRLFTGLFTTSITTGFTTSSILTPTSASACLQVLSLLCTQAKKKI